MYNNSEYPQLELQARKDLEAGRITEEQFRQSLEDLGLPAEIAERYLVDRSDRPGTPLDPLMEQLVPMIESMIGTMRYQTAALEITKLAATTGKPVNVIIDLYRDSLDRLQEEYPAREEL